ncbi:MFS family permease [Catenulispora sp. GP43]|uniref:MFS transporter n=1 Tax=Catenulispora sp. GP43 TaxID=3156263 RepID=UPI003512F227
MSSTPRRGPGLCMVSLGTVTTFLAAWNSLAVLVVLGPRPHVSVAVLVGIAAAFDAAAAVAVGAGTVWSGRVGSRTALASGSAVFALACAGCALASGPLLVAARTVQGIAAALMVAAALEALSGPTGRGEPCGGDGFQTAGVGATLVCGPLVAGAVAAVHGWRWVFWAEAIVGAGICCVVLVLVRGGRGASAAAARDDDGGAAITAAVSVSVSAADRTPRPRDRFDLPALAFATVAVAGPIGALTEAAASGWGDVRTLALLAAGLVALVPILVWHTPPGALYSRAFVAAQVADLCLFAATAGTLFLLAQYFHAVAGSGSLGVGLRIVPWSAAVAVALSASASAQARARGMRRLMAAGLALDAVGLLGLAAAVRGRQTGWWLAVSLVLSGAGVGLAMPAARRAAVTVAGLRQPEGAVGGLGAVRWAGAGLGIALLGAVLAARGGIGSAAADRGAGPAVAAAALVAALVAAAGAAAALTLPTRERPPMVPVFSRTQHDGPGPSSRRT